ncbi:MAG: hypothetical protein GXY32_08270 [Ruminococcaceae bacterium]|nr:hypothetical protein [Oscillospiraceae bacterium]
MKATAKELDRVSAPPLPRPRVEALLEAAFTCPVVAVFAGQGYGKRQLVADFLARRGAAVVWVSLTKLDNLPERFWQSLLAAAQESGLMPDLPARLQAFPKAPGGAEAFARALAGCTGAQQRLVLVIEAHECIRDAEIQALIQALAACQVEYFSLWLLGRVPPAS